MRNIRNMRNIKNIKNINILDLARSTVHVNRWEAKDAILSPRTPSPYSVPREEAVVATVGRLFLHHLPNGSGFKQRCRPKTAARALLDWPAMVFMEVLRIWSHKPSLIYIVYLVDGSSKQPACELCFHHLDPRHQQPSLPWYVRTQSLTMAPVQVVK